MQVWLRSLGRNMSRLWPALGALGMDGPALVCALRPGSDLPLLLGASLPPTRPNPYATGGNAGCVNGAPGKVPASLGMAAGGMPRGAGTALMGSGGMGLNALLTGRLEPWLLEEAKRAAALMQALAAVVKSTSPSSKQAPGASMVNGSPCQNTTSNTQALSAQQTSFANGSPQAPLTSNIPPLPLSSLHAVTTATTTGASSSEGGALPPPAYCRTPAPACHLSPLELGLLLADTFRYYDADADGYLDEREMSQLVQWSGLPLRQEQVRAGGRVCVLMTAISLLVTGVASEYVAAGPLPCLCFPYSWGTAESLNKVCHHDQPPPSAMGLAGMHRTLMTCLRTSVVCTWVACILLSARLMHCF